MADDGGGTTVVGRLRTASVSLMNYNPQLGMWAATGAAIAQAPNLTELRQPVAGGANIEFDEHGHSARTVTTDEDGMPVLSPSMTKTATRILVDEADPKGQPARPTPVRRQTLLEQSQMEEKHSWGETILHGLNAAWKFLCTPTGFVMAIYGLNIVAWGAMLFFLLLDAAPAMDHPNKDSNDSPRKKWLEIDSQILNALFCVTGFGLAPWRFRDLYWLIQARLKNRYAMGRLNQQNKSWFRPPAWFEEGEEQVEDVFPKRITFTGEVAPPTSLWKLSFVIWMMVANTLLQAVLASFMWAYNRINRPSWATGTFIALGCGVSMGAGVMMWWEGRKVKKIEGPVIKVVEATNTEQGTG
ncbi:hypothetical protein LOCC1_G004753 [Lachnellula occidentalis]|uniref:Uncharacterized protein n=1 Tax=Lachnellula occidentalis TaxID=215460 RepID=A0A8H8RZZ9_9HELO|nr:hypothetical protein LOCC1_G004753 [Lachnellula occidentalis]